jgi:HAUS augmin-like complex subunit 1
MDLDEHALPTALFSPSKAAAQRAQAQDWHTIDVWLSSKYQGRSVPTFERNEDTLKTLLELVAANERADEERDLMWGVWGEGLGELVRGMGEVSARMPEEITRHVDRLNRQIHHSRHI